MFKKFFVTFLIVIILSLSVNDCYFISNNIPCKKVEAAEVVLTGLALPAMYAICYYFGTIALGGVPQKIRNLSDDSIAEVGHKFIQKITDPDDIDHQNLRAIVALDEDGRAYSLGEEALRNIAATTFLAMKMAQYQQNNNSENNDNEEENDDEDENGKVKFPKNNNFKKIAFALSSGLALSVGVVFKDQIRKLFNKEESIFDGLEMYTIEEQTDGGVFTPKFIGYNTQVINGQTIVYKYVADGVNRVNPSFPIDSSQYKIFGYKQGNTLRFRIYELSNNYCGSQTLYFTYSCYRDGNYLEYTENSYSWRIAEGYPYSANFPIFETEADGKAWARNYRVADWLDDDWTGDLIDPLTGYNRASDLFPMIAHDGLANVPNLQEWLDWLRDFFRNQKETVPQPYYNPQVEPVKYPSNAPDIIPAVGENGAITIPWPDPVGDSDPGTDPDPQPGTDSPGIDDLPDLVPDLDVGIPDLSDLLKTKFPFCIPWDLKEVLLSFRAEALIPHYEIPVHFTFFGISYDEMLVIDLAQFQRLSRFIRTLITILYIIGLMMFSVRHFGKDM